MGFLSISSYSSIVLDFIVDVFHGKYDFQVLYCTPCGGAVLIWWVCLKATTYSEELNSHRHGMTSSQGWLILCFRYVSLFLVAHRAIQVLANLRVGICGTSSPFAFPASGSTTF